MVDPVDRPRPEDRDPGSRASPRRGRRPISDDDRRRQQLDVSRAAIRLFRDQGVDATTGDQIAAAAGISGRTLWRWFATKESCVEPVLSLALDRFLASLRRWPAALPLDQHLITDHRLPDPDHPEDAELSLAVIRLSRTHPGLRAVWLVLHERIEPVLAEILAERDGWLADSVPVRVKAAALAAAMRIATEQIAGTGLGDPRRNAETLAAAVRAAAP